MLFLIVITLLVIAFAEPLGERIGVVAPVILLVVGAAAAYLPQVPEVFVEPEIILQLILPPLLFATAMRMPDHDFRRNLSAIFALAVLLVGVTSVCVGAAIHFLVPEIPLAYAIAVGAVVSPSDAVAVGIVRRAGVNRRIVAVLDGEGLINDASALVILGSSLLAARSHVTAGEVAASFLWAVVGAVLVGYCVGKVAMLLRRFLHHASSNTVLSLAIPFAAFLPAEEVGASGLVATVVAGLVVADAAARELHPATRISDNRTWDAVGLILESLVFVLMGLQMPHLINEATASGFTFAASLWVALAVWVVVLVVRCLAVAPLLGFLRRSTVRLRKRSVEDAAGGTSRKRTVRRLADGAYYAKKPLGVRAGGVIVWAGMRGAVTLAAAQTLPQDTPARGFLILVAFIVAAVSLVVQGGTLGWVVAVLKPGADEPSSPEEREWVRKQLDEAAAGIAVPPSLRHRLVSQGVSPAKVPHATLIDLARAGRELMAESPGEAGGVWEYAAERVSVQREALVRIREAGLIDAPDFDRELRIIDGEQLAVEALARDGSTGALR